MTNAIASGRTRFGVLALALLLAPIQAAAAQEMPCPLPGQKEVLAVRLFFGENIEGRKPLADTEWEAFLSQTVTPRFPAGLTVYDAHGQWMDTRTRRIGGENSKVIELETQDTPTSRKSIAEIAHAYRERFHQQAVGIVTSRACAAF